MTPSYPPPSSQHQEMEAAFDDSDGSGSEDENAPLAQRARREDRREGDEPPASTSIVVPLREPTDGVLSYDFDRDYVSSPSWLLPFGLGLPPQACSPIGLPFPLFAQFLPPPGSPPPGAYPENYMPTGPTPLLTTPSYPRPHSSVDSGPSRFFRSILPTHFTRPTGASAAPRGSDGVWANLNAKPEVEQPVRLAVDGDGDNTNVMAEFSSKDIPPVCPSSFFFLFSFRFQRTDMCLCLFYRRTLWL